MHKFALIGRDIQHSKSKDMYEDLLQENISYTLIDCDQAEKIPTAKELLAKYEGVSITAPYKEHFINEVLLTDEIKKLGRINCLGPIDKKIHGTNTDYLAVTDYFTRLTEQYAIKEIEVIILGDGSMSNITQYALTHIGITPQVLSRSNGDDLENCNLSYLFQTSTSYKLIINTCGRGFVFRGKVDKSIIFWDYNYSFSPHSYLTKLCQYEDGLSLLKSQAAYALKFWKIK